MADLSSVLASMKIRPLMPGDWPAVEEIYLQGIRTGNATFETTSPGWEAWDAEHLESCRWVAESEEGMAGWAALSGVSDRCVYGGVAEVSVYVADSFQGRGVGTVLLDALIRASEEAGIWTLQAGIFPENVASIRIHQKLGFRTVGLRERLGKLGGSWRDVVLMERRSRRVGV
jgi:phosphinothricin acetyltransferase